MHSNTKPATRGGMTERRMRQLVRVERYRLVAAGSVDPVVLDLERHRPGIGRHQAPVRDRRTMGATRAMPNTSARTSAASLIWDYLFGTYQVKRPERSAMGSSIPNRRT